MTEPGNRELFSHARPRAGIRCCRRRLGSARE
jgi:hypothetical protein